MNIDRVNGLFKFYNNLFFALENETNPEVLKVMLDVYPDLIALILEGVIQAKAEA